MEAWKELNESIKDLDLTIEKACHAYAHVSGDFHKVYYGYWVSYKDCEESGHSILETTLGPSQ